MNSNLAPIAILGIEDPDWNAVAVAAVTALVVTLLTTLVKERLRLSTESQLHRRKADADYEYEQRKKLRDKIGEYRGQLLEAATDFNYRLANLDANVEKGWLDIGGAYGEPSGAHYYFRTTVYRFAVLTSVANRFEQDALHIDERIAQPTDLTFLLYIKAFRWAMTDTSLFEDLDYDISADTDHFLTDRLRQMCAAMYADSRQLRFAEFEERIPSFDLLDALRFFDGLQRNSLKWDRLVVFRLLLLSFINTFGYSMQRSPQEHFDLVAAGIARDAVARNLRSWLGPLGLADDPEAQRISTALAKRLTPTRPRP